MGHRVNCQLNEICPVESTKEQCCCVSLISSADLLAEGVAQSLQCHSSIFLQDRFESFDDLENSKAPRCYEVILINVRMIQYPLSAFFQQLQIAVPQARIIVFAAESEPQLIKSLMRAGVYGFVPIEASASELYEAILSVKSGELWFDKSLLDEMVFDAMEFERLIEQSIKDRIGVLKDQLTRRERDVFSLVLEGLSTRQIATQIHMSEPTVKQHLTSLFKKFDVSNRSQLILVAFERVCPVTNMVKLFRRVLDRQRVEKGGIALIADPLKD